MTFLAGYIAAVVFILGSAVGSFLNVVLYRMHTGKSLRGRSHCLSCQKKLVWFELIPLFSYLFLKGRCKGCGSFVPIRYFIVELLTGISFLFVFLLYAQNALLLILNLVLITILILIVVYDMYHTIIPDELVLLIGALALLIVGYNAYTDGLYVITDGLLGALLASLFFAGLWMYSKGRWIGLGDAKLAFPLGFIVGVGHVFSFIVFSFWIGAVISLSILLIQLLLKRGKHRLPFLRVPLKMKSEVPFAPFLVLGFLIVHFFNIDVFIFTYYLLF